MIACVLNFANIFFRLYKIKEFVRIFSFNLLQNIVLKIFMVRKYTS